MLFDPYLRRKSRALPPFPLDDIRDVAAIFITHPHLDHFADMDAVMEKCPAPVYVCRRGIEIAMEQGFDASRMHPMAPGDRVRVGGMTVLAYQSRHCEYDVPILRETLSRALRPGRLRDGLALDAQNHHFKIDMCRDVLAYEVAAEDRRVFLLGSAGCCESMEYPTGADLLIYPYQGRSDMREYSLKFLDIFRPRRVMLDHFDDAFPPISCDMDCEPFIQKAKKLHPEMEIWKPEMMMAYEV